MKDELTVNVLSYLTFKMEDEIYAIDTTYVLHILEMVKIAKVPKAPDYMLGVINLRGNIIAVIDSRKKFDLQTVPFTSNTCILILEVKSEGGNIQFGIVVDEVKEVIELKVTEIKAPPSIGDKYNADFLDGVALIEENFIMLLNIEKFLSVKEIKSLKKASKVKEELESIE